MAKHDEHGKVVAENRKARHEYIVEDTIEAGLMLTGTEVKSLRTGRANIQESYASPENGEMWLINAHIPEYEQGNRYNHEPRRKRKLLVHRREIDKLQGVVKREGMTLVPLKLYFDQRGRAKLLLGIARGKKAHDKREADKQRDWDRQKQRLMRQNY
ncbi:MAG TPA: SsrA-binding protein [Alphaproteobacteria bacterium]|jgi:SsrA-binding protein|nr:SsrA-binding protein [Paracoccaceae bacterium]RCL79835.1 MAG: SsrA-binding protein SmpB [SAR116 cluster bacterium]HCY48157.1 SsrA-binding protein [Alphaproteobacteria bacterium]|tara:strand:+ start:609 stop:1079 length:471 start_codon:yes stop_codon:yes gene_type:complete